MTKKTSKKRRISRATKQRVAEGGRKAAKAGLVAALIAIVEILGSEKKQAKKA